MSLMHLVLDSGEIARRRAALPAGSFVEAWPDLSTPSHVWLGTEAKQLLDRAGPPLPSSLSLEGDHVRVYYGPRLTALESLPTEESLRARVLSAGGMAVAWITLDQFGERTLARTDSPLDPVFFLRRRGGGSAHQWRLFRTRDEAVTFMREHYGNDPEAQAWAADLSPESFDGLIERHARRPPPGSS